MPRIKVLAAKAGRIRNGRFTAGKRNVAHGRTTGTGKSRRFIPFRSFEGEPTADYDPTFDAAYREGISKKKAVKGKAKGKGKTKVKAKTKAKAKAKTKTKRKGGR